MSKSWTILIFFALFLFIIVTAYDFVQSLTGNTNTRKYQITQIEDDLGTDTLNFLNQKKSNILVEEDEI